ncbi:DUF5452 family protein [Mycoplasmoides pneumoniae]|uniref:Uncharacterized protein MG286 homolog n=1 Tax=Mycoplasma pneumoniae (strain ATCC 29342 / M129 / Subtype 1) TaxID=272634 RepID=Y405_MYCPN|nr:DUF5452 family protein [Mycoplasmoides pneumoniae]P75379.1 RecName: Full=Uncharacterized protein MG286 homolog [Mycoplasmoides pneumoniae M129]AAB96081.1 conserved hypothetical protein [Mycoplasmoides pneumoniae M129]AGC04313.1 hypothetical protein C985_0413 [Mycoplasmoides pneumoniae M129-B7]ALA30284.1 hypothetical protein C897_02320 [Mycoplasmoides pneumoniae PI 1428]ALA32392.1 hypothetical protein F533_02320 [Mycoplasmoides pneumoniae 51494]ALA33092.1 hypothetical protein F530_02320 [My
MIFSISKRKLICGFSLVALTIAGIVGGVYLVTKNNQQTTPQTNHFNVADPVNKVPNWRKLGPETQRELRDLLYPLDDTGYFIYKYGAISRYLQSQKELDELVDYRTVLPSTQKHFKYDSFNQSVLESKLRKWLMKAIKQHPYFQHFEFDPVLKAQYNINIPAQKITVNAVWFYKKDNDLTTGKPIRYWDQFEIKLKQ